MASGPDHYREAERLLAAGRGDVAVLLEALSHAALALAAATALKSPSRSRWGKVAGRQEADR